MADKTQHILETIALLIDELDNEELEKMREKYAKIIE